MTVINEKIVSALKWIAIALIIIGAKYKPLRYSTFGFIVPVIGCAILATIYIQSLTLYLKHTSKAHRRRSLTLYLWALTLFWTGLTLSILIANIIYANEV